MATSGFERRCTSAILENPIARELSTLDFVQDLLHRRPSFLGDDAWTTRVVTVLSRVANAVPHVVQTALIEQVDDQLQFVHALEVGHLRLITSFDQRIQKPL